MGPFFQPGMNRKCPMRHFPSDPPRKWCRDLEDNNENYQTDRAMWKP